jgi:hypothetical protein
MTLNTGPAILSRLIDAEPHDLPPEAARSLLRWDFSTSDHARMAELSAKAQSPTITEDEREELREYIRVADLLAVLQSKARVALRRPGRAS